MPCGFGDTGISPTTLFVAGSITLSLSSSLFATYTWTELAISGTEQATARKSRIFMQIIIPPDERSRTALLTGGVRRIILKTDMKLSFNKDAGTGSDSRPQTGLRRLAELRPGEQAILEKLELPEDDARRLMELGFLPGHTVTPALAAPGGDPRVFRVDGSEIALRRETAARMLVRS